MQLLSPQFLYVVFLRSTFLKTLLWSGRFFFLTSPFTEFFFIDKRRAGLQFIPFIPTCRGASVGATEKQSHLYGKMNDPNE